MPVVVLRGDQIVPGLKFLTYTTKEGFLVVKEVKDGRMFFVEPVPHLWVDGVEVSSGSDWSEWYFEVDLDTVLSGHWL